MTFKRALAIALTAAAALPASAAAQAPITPPDGDNYLSPVGLSDFQHPAKFPSQEIGFVADTTNYTTQADMFNPPTSGGPPEPTGCPAAYGKTIWSVFHADRWGRMQINTAGPFDTVIGFVPFADPTSNPAPDLRHGFCEDRLSGFEESMTQLVQPGHWYAVQVGGTGAVQGGQVQVKFHYLKPSALKSDVVLTWNTARSGAKVAKLVVTAPKGSTVSVHCTKHGCKAPRAFTVKKKPVAFRPIGAVGPGAPAPAGLEMKAAGSSSAAGLVVGSGEGSSARVAAKPETVSAAGKFTLMKGASLKAGSHLIIQVTQFGQIGGYYDYAVQKTGVGTKTIRCTNPSSNKPRKTCG
jgi:hypothetical protein